MGVGRQVPADEKMNRRVRASTPRTKTGCANCRQRRIKCDEAEPACERCRRSGWICPGYVQIDGSQLVVFNDAAPARTPPTASSITQYSLPFKIPGSQEERRALHYFANFAAIDLTGYIPTTFWSRTVLQRCQHDVPVRHAAAALGRVHLEYMTGSHSFKASADAVEAFQKSLKALRNYLGRQSTPDNAMVLICSAIFFSFELVGGDRRTALRHLQSGLDILEVWLERHSANSTEADIKTELTAVYSRLDLQATMFDDGRAPVLQVNDYDQGNADSDDGLVERAFESLDEAQQCLFPLLHQAFSFLVQHTPYKFVDCRIIPQPVSERRKRLVDKLDVWEKRIELLEYQYQTNPDAGVSSELRDRLRGFSTSKLYHRTIRLLLQHSLQDEVKRYALSFDNEAHKLLELARNAILDHNDVSSPPSNDISRRCFYLHLGIVAPIYLLAMKSNDSKVVRESIELLHAAKGRREGFYDAEQMAQVAESLAQIQADGRARGAYISVEERLLAVQPPSASLEWVAEEVMQVQLPYHWHDEEGRWKGYDRLLALVA